MEFSGLRGEAAAAGGVWCLSVLLSEEEGARISVGIVSLSSIKG